MHFLFFENKCAIIQEGNTRYLCGTAILKYGKPKCNLLLYILRRLEWRWGVVSYG